MNLRLQLYVLLVLVATGCAKQTSPTGGPKDETPPHLVTSTPQKKQLNYKGKTIQLTFDEAVIVNNPREQVLITPSISSTFEMTSRKKSVILKFEEAFADSTTYTINFRESIQDITEKNSAENLQIAFSTGPYIDSLSISGTVTDLLKGSPLKDASIALYQSDTFDIFTDKPIYLTKTNDSGEFKFENLKNGTFYIYAFADKNKNLIVDSKSEDYGFRTEPIELNQNIDSIDLSLIHLDSRPLELASARPYNTYFNIRTNKNLYDFSITAPNDSIELLNCYGEDRSNIRIYNNLQELDSLLINFKATDSIQNTIDTSFFIKFIDRKVDPEKFTQTIDRPEIIVDKGIFQTLIRFTKPLASVNFDSLLILKDSSTTIPIVAEDLEWLPKTNQLRIKKSIDKTLFAPKATASPFGKQKPIQGKKPELVNQQDSIARPPKVLDLFYTAKATFVSVENDSSAAVQQKLTVITPEGSGTIIVQIQTQAENFIIELLDKSYTVLQSFTNTSNVTFSNLDPKDYQLRLIIDTNGNGQWDPGNFYTKQQPEPVKYYKSFDSHTQTVTVKANWEVGPLLISY